MDALEIESKIIEIGQKIIKLRDELATNQQILIEDEEYVAELMAQLGKNEVKDGLEEVKVVRTVKKVRKFDSPAFKKSDPKMYAEYQEPTVRFNQKKLEKEQPDVYNSYLTEEEVISVSIERWIDEGSLPEL